jgi:transposase
MAEVFMRRHYNDDFKREAVRVLYESNKPVTTVAASIGIDQSNLHKWKQIYKHEFTEKPDAFKDENMIMSKIRSLEQEIASVKETVDVLRNVIKKSLNNKLDLDKE